jgi:outer membrane protein OmpA-like peptidoglycan-associated protein
VNRSIQAFLFTGLFLWLSALALAQDANYPLLQHNYYYAVAGVFQEEANASELYLAAKNHFPNSFIARHPETGLFYLLLEKSPRPFAGKITEMRKVSGFDQVWLYRYLASSPKPDSEATTTMAEEGSQEMASLGTKKRDLKDSLDKPEPTLKELERSQEGSFRREQNLADTTNRALDLLMRTASSSGESSKEGLAPNQNQGGVAQKRENQEPKDESSEKITAYSAFDAELPRLENHVYTSPPQPYEEEFTLLVQTGSTKSGDVMDIELLDGHQQVRFIRLAPNQVHQVRIPKDAMRDLVLRGVVEGEYTFSLVLDLLVLFYSKELNSKLIDVTERNLIIFPPSDFLDSNSPRYVFYFQNGSSVFERSCHYELNELVRFLKEHPERGVSVTGYTNAGGMGRAWKNIHDEFFKISDLTIKQDALAMDLALDRAMSVQRYLIKQGIAPVRIQVQANTSRKLFRSTMFEGRYNARAEVFID